MNLMNTSPGAQSARLRPRLESCTNPNEGGLFLMLPFSSPRPRPARAAGRLPLYRPQLESLEDRLAPALLTVLSNLDDNGAGTLRALLATANADAASGISDTIKFDSGLAGQTITLTQGQLALSGAGGGKITIDGSDLSSPITISGNHASRVFKVDSGVQAELDALTITGGTVSSADGGGIRNGGTLILSSCTLADNIAFGGGAIANRAGGVLTVTASSLSGNSSTGGGGGIWNLGALNVSGCTLADNSAATGGGGIANDNLLAGALTVTDSILSGNHASHNSGGGIATVGAAEVSGCTFSNNSTDNSGGGFVGSGELTDCTFLSNSARYGGGIAGDVVVQGCALSGNSAVAGGGGICSGEFGNLSVSASVLSGNSAQFGGGIMNDGTLLVSGCTLSGNSAISGIFAGSGLGGAIFNTYDAETVLVSNCTLSGNSAATSGGGIFSIENVKLTVSSCTVSGNSAAVSGGGIYRSADYIRTLTINTSSAVCDNQAPSGADFENVLASYAQYPDGSPPFLTISHSAVEVLHDTRPEATTITNDDTDTAASLTASVNGDGQIVFDVRVLAANAAAGVPAGSVKLCDGNGAEIQDTLTSLVDGWAEYSDPTVVAQVLASAAPVHAVYVPTGSFAASASAPLIPAVKAPTPGDLQTVVTSLGSNSATAAALDVSPSSEAAAVSAINGLTNLAGPVTVVLNLAAGKYASATISPPNNVTVIINGAVTNTIIDPPTPALTVASGNVIVRNVTFTESGDAPTVLVTGGKLTLRNCVVEESTGYAEPAITATGGSLDLGTAASPGGNTININGAGQVLAASAPGLVTTAGNTFQADGVALFPFATVALASSANTSLLNQSVTFTATASAPYSGGPVPTGTVAFIDAATGTALATVPLSGGTAQWAVSSLAPGAHTIAAVYGGDTHYLASAATLVQRVETYHFSGFQAPLASKLVLALNRTVPIKFSLTDNNGPVTSLSAIKSLQVLDAGGTNILSNGGGTALRYDSTSNQFVANWQTRGLSAGACIVRLVLADGTVKTMIVHLAAPGSAKLQASGNEGPTAGALLGGDLALYVDDSNGALSEEELARIGDAAAAIDGTLAPYGMTVTVVDDPIMANVTLAMNATSPVGGYADGVLGCTTEDGQITLIQGWDFYAGAAQPGAAQYDFQTVVTHELGHALGLGHSADAASVMYATLPAGSARRSLASADLDVPDEGGPGGLHALPPTTAASTVSTASQPACLPAGNGGDGLIRGASGEDADEAALWALVAEWPSGNDIAPSLATLASSDRGRPLMLGEIGSEERAAALPAGGTVQDRVFTNFRRGTLNEDTDLSGNDLAGEENASTAALFQGDFQLKGVNLDA
jgi:hypothetical protein